MDTRSEPVAGGLRPQLVPHAAVGALVVAAGAARIAVHVTGDEQQVAVWVAGAAFVIAVVAATKVRGRVFDRRARRRAYTFAAVAGVWLVSVTVAGLSLGAVGILMAFGYALSTHWWRSRPVGLIQQKTSRSEYQRLWAENVGRPDGALPGSSLRDPQPIKAGIRYTLRLRPGKQDLGMVIAAAKKLRGGLRLQADQELLIEAHPTEREPDVLLTIVTRSPIRSSVYWPGPEAFDSASGRVILGPYADGEGRAAWRAYTENRLWGGYVQGGTGSGKSRLIESVAMSLAASASHPTVILYGDGQGGASSPLLMAHADFRARTHQQILVMLEGMHLVMLLRQDENAIAAREGFTPTDDRPGLLGIIDECHKPMSKLENAGAWQRVQYLASTIAREGGKVGVALLLASQAPTLDAFGGAGTPSAEAIRSNLLAGNGVMMRGKDPNAKTVFKVDVDPSQFPLLPGYGYLIDPAPGARSAQFRSYYLGDEQRQVWPKRIAWRSLDSGSAAAWGVTYLRRHQMAEEAVAAARQRIAARRAGVALDVSVAPVPPSTVGAIDLQVFPSWQEFVARAEQEAQRALREGHQRVLAAIRSGCTGPKAIQAATRYSERQVHNLLGDLLEAGEIAKGGYGRYELTGAA
ncbi:hypothetical protein QTQ03_25225 [Micromonospora sp. WMMA1363]|uniref:hypothetical protein n=1 Tax=Micromonospora sp. WMMA1363 TaxID=3053985 RepID=UPI00259CD3BA|nr:hypothetical protein [Micromonospora sp. WMMA1363]MDM4722737.1 hypothetical protein [Micromonospora sp. WMMA1363]